VGKLGSVRIEFGRVNRLKRLAHPTVQGHRARGRQFVVQHLADDFVRETVAARSAWHRHQHADGEGFLEMINNMSRLNSACGCEDVDAEFAADDGRDGEQLPALLGEQG